MPRRIVHLKSCRCAFSLIELLATVSILSVLISLLLPATQAAREAARQAACRNNLKQVGLALANFETANRRYPIGARRSPIVGFGTSWWADILPQLEEATLYGKLNFNVGNAGYPLLAPGNAQVIDGVIIPIMHCPSSELAVLRDDHGTKVGLPCYTGIAGASNEDSLSGTPTQTCCSPGMLGIISAGGILYPNASVRLQEVTDGAGHTLAVAEQSDFAVDHLGRPRNVDGGYPMGWLVGTTSSGTPPSMKNLAGINPNPTAAWNTTTVKYPPNTRTFELPGIDDANHGPNNPLLSPHSGGVNGLLLDGAVHFIHEGIDMLTLRRLATRNDGGSVSF